MFSPEKSLFVANSSSGAEPCWRVSFKAREEYFVKGPRRAGGGRVQACA